MKIIVIIPTYNEAKSIGRLIDILEEEFKNIPNHQLEMLIVDGNSPDGTANLIKEKIKNYPNLHLLVEKEKRGLGMAYISGMKHAVDKLGADVVVEFDGDGQHNPKDIKRLISEMDNGYDYVIGSRYVTGGSIPAAWGWHRKFLSRFGSWFIKFMLCLPTEDNTSGFKLTRVKNFFNKLPLDENQILSKRHAYKIHFLHAMIKAGAKTKEIPIKFLERSGGDSKSSAEDIWESLWVVFRLYVKNSQ